MPASLREAQTLEAHERLLTEYDAAHRAAAAAPGSKGLGGALTANEWSRGEDPDALAAAVRSLCAAARARGGRVMLGICASDADAGVAALKGWVGGLALPKGVLHGMDVNGVPIDMSTFGAVYLKYNSEPGASGDPPGTAIISGYSLGPAVSLACGCTRTGVGTATAIHPVRAVHSRSRPARSGWFGMAMALEPRTGKAYR